MQARVLTLQRTYRGIHFDYIFFLHLQNTHTMRCGVGISVITCHNVIGKEKERAFPIYYVENVTLIFNNDEDNKADFDGTTKGKEDNRAIVVSSLHLIVGSKYPAHLYNEDTRLYADCPCVCILRMYSPVK